MITLIKKQGMHNVYQTPFGIVWIGRCTNPNIYEKTGYYLEYSNMTKDSNLCEIAFKTSKKAVDSFVRYMSNK